MKSDVAEIQYNQRRKVSFSQCALLSVLLVIATKFCTLPSVITGIANSKAVWCVLILVTLELAILFFAASVAKCGGLTEIPLKKGVRIPLLLLFLGFFILKLTALSREISTYFALSLFENAPVLPILILLLIACALLAQKGLMAIGRLMEIFVWAFLFVLIFVLIFTRTEGDLFNALGMFSPDLSKLGEGVWKGLAWFGDGAAVAFFDLRGEERFSPHAKGESPSPSRQKAKGKIAFSAALASVLIVVLFYAVFIAVYGDAAKMTDYAFIKLSAFKANTDELGSADWPVIILWSILSCLYLALLFLSGKECLTGLFEKTRQSKGKGWLPYLLLGGSAVLLSTLFLGEEGDYSNFMTKGMNVVTVIVMATILGVGGYALAQRKGAQREKQN